MTGNIFVSEFSQILSTWRKSTQITALNSVSLFFLLKKKRLCRHETKWLWSIKNTK